MWCYLQTTHCSAESWETESLKCQANNSSFFKMWCHITLKRNEVSQHKNKYHISLWMVSYYTDMDAGHHCVDDVTLFWCVQPGAVKMVLWHHWMHLSYIQWRQRTNFTAPGCINVTMMCVYRSPLCGWCHAVLMCKHVTIIHCFFSHCHSLCPNTKAIAFSLTTILFFFCVAVLYLSHWGSFRKDNLEFCLRALYVSPKGVLPLPQARQLEIIQWHW